MHDGHYGSCLSPRRIVDLVFRCMIEVLRRKKKRWLRMIRLYHIKQFYRVIKFTIHDDNEVSDPHIHPETGLNDL